MTNKDTASCVVTPSTIASANGAATISVTSNANPFAFTVTSPDGVEASWPQSGAGTVQYPYPPAADYYPLQVGNYVVTVYSFPGKHGRKAIGSGSFTVTP